MKKKRFHVLGLQLERRCDTTKPERTKKMESEIPVVPYSYPAYSCCCPLSREHKRCRTFRATFSSPSSILAYVVGNSRRSWPSTTHTLHCAGYAAPTSASSPPVSPSALKNRGRGYPCVLQYSNNSSLQEVDDSVSFVAGSDAGIASGYANELEEVGDGDEDDDDADADAGPTSSSATADAGRSSSGGRGERTPLRLASTLAA